MTREEMAREVLAEYLDLADDTLIDAVAAMLAFADAEAAAMRERAADYLDGYAGGHHMAKSCAAAIRALPATGEVE